MLNSLLVRFLYPLYLLFILCTFAQAQKSWTKTYRDGAELRTIHQFGESYIGFGHYQDQLYMIKTDLHGNQTMEKVFMDSLIQSFHVSKSSKTLDGCLLVCGTTNWPSNYESLKLYKIDTSGTILWESTISNSNSNHFKSSSIVTLLDSTFVIVFETSLQGHMIKLSKSGQETNRINFGYEFMYPDNAVLNKNGTITAVGSRAIHGQHSFIMNFSQSGALNWSHKLDQSYSHFENVTESLYGIQSVYSRGNRSKVFVHNATGSVVKSVNMTLPYLFTSITSDDYGSLVASIMARGRYGGLVTIDKDGNVSILKIDSSYSNSIAANKVLADHDNNYLYVGKLDGRALISKYANNPTQSRISHIFNCQDSTVSFELLSNKPDSILWQFGDDYSLITNTNKVKHKYNNLGSYEVHAHLYFPNRVRVITEKVTLSYPTKPSLGPDTLICKSESLVVKIDGAQYDKFSWSTRDTLDQITIQDSGVFIVETELNGCKQMDTIVVDFVDCRFKVEGHCVKMPSRVTLNEDMLDSIQWQHNGIHVGTDLENRFEYTFNSSGNHTLSAKLFKSGMEKLLSIPIDITQIDQNYLADSIEVCDSIDLVPHSIGQTGKDLELLWNDSITTRTLRASESGWNSLKLKKRGCEVIDSIYVRVEKCNCQVFVPSVFSPNMDGLNDNFRFVTQCSIYSLEFKIYDRWGKKIFETENPNNPWWNGQYSGKECPIGFYFWTLVITPEDEAIRRYGGLVKLIR